MIVDREAVHSLRQVRGSLWFGLLVTSLLYGLNYRFTIDDAAISFTYAENLARGRGLGVIDPMGYLAEGYSNFLWVLLLAACGRFTANLILVSKILGFVFTLASVWVLHRIVERLVTRTWVLWGVALLPVCFPFTLWSVSGLENSLFGLLLLAGTCSLMREDRDPRAAPIGSAMILVGVSLTRPDGVVYGATAFVYKAIQSVSCARSQRMLHLRNLAVWAALFAAGYGTYHVWHYARFASVWPNTAYAKVAGGVSVSRIFAEIVDLRSPGWRYVRGFFSRAGAGMVPGIGLGVWFTMTGRERLLAMNAAAALVLPLFSPDWMEHWRFLFPFFPFAIALTLIGADRTLTACARAQRSVGLAALGALSLVGGVAHYAVTNLATGARERRAGYRGNVTLADTLGYRLLGVEAEELGLTDALFALPDIGGPSYVLGMRILDTAGLADVHVALSGLDTRVLAQYLLERRPDFVHLHPPWMLGGAMSTNALRSAYLCKGSGDGNFVRKDLLVSTSTVDGDAMATTSTGLALVKILLPERIEPGARPMLVSYWQARRRQDQALSQRVRLIGPQGIVYDETTPLSRGWYPTDQWRSEEVVRQLVRLPPVGLGQHAIEVSIVDSLMRPLLPGPYRRVLDAGPIDQARAVEEALVRAQRLVSAGSFHGALDEIEDLAGTVADPGRLDGPRAQIRDFAARAIHDRVRSGLLAGDARAVLDAVRDAPYVRPMGPLRREWRTLAEDLESRAVRETRDRERAYAWARAAVELDPWNGHYLRILEQARRSYAAIGPATGTSSQAAER
jgi:hypothetical protein